MAVFGYAGRRRVDGAPVRGRLQAPDARAAAERLRADGVLITELRTLGTPWTWERMLQLDLTPRRISARDLALFCRQLATLLGAGVPVLSALGLLARPDRRSAVSSGVQRLAARVAARVSGGGSLSSALEAESPQVPALMVHMVAAGEAGGVLVEVLQRLADHFERDLVLRGRVRAALIYPAVVVAVAIGVVLFMVTVVLPQFSSLYGQLGVPLPRLTQLVLTASQLLRHIGALLLLGCIALAALGYGALRRPAGRRRLHALLLYLPVAGELARKWALARFARTLAALLRSGVTLLAALPVAARVMDNAVLGETMEAASETIRHGGLLSDALQSSGQVPAMVVRMVAVGEETGSLDGMLDKAADFYEREVDMLVGRLTALLEPALMLVLGSLVGFILVAVLAPMYSVFNKFA